jgi:iron complex outermembrane recepter protein
MCTRSFIHPSLSVAVFILLIMKLPGVDLRGQTSAGTIQGVVKGPDGALLPGAQVSIKEAASGTAISVVTGPRGAYRITNLPPGNYGLEISLAGFERRSLAGILLEPGQSQVVDVSLAIATIREVVTVVGTAHDSLEAAAARESSARDVGEALAHTEGLWKVRKGGIANDVVMRGLQGEDLNILIDGQRIYGACPNHMDPPAFHADFSEVDRIEIAKGPFDMRNEGSLGGIINIVTRKPLSGFHAAADLSAGSSGYLNPSAQVSFGRGSFSALGGYSYRQSDPYRDGSGHAFTQYANYQATEADRHAFEVGTGWSKFFFQPGNNHWVDLSYTRQQADHVLYPYLQMDAIYDNADRASVGYQVDGRTGLVRSFHAKAYFSQVIHWMTDAFRTSASGFSRGYSMGTLARTRALGGKIEADLSHVTMGVEAFRREWRASTALAARSYQSQYSIPDVSSIAVGIYAIHRQDLSDNLKLDLGGRVDRVSDDANSSEADTNLFYAYHSTRRTTSTDAFPSGSVRLSYTLSSRVELSLGAGHTVRVPDPRERFFGLRRMGSDWVGNPELSPSRNSGADLTMSLRFQGLSLGSSLYFSRIAHYIAVYGQAKINPTAGIMNALARTYANVDARLFGGELESSYLVSRRIFLSGNLAFVRGTATPDAALGMFSHNLSEIPPLTGRTSMRYDTGKFAIELEGQFAGAQTHVNADLREAPTPGYGLANLAISGKIRHFVVRMALNNLFDRYYIEHLSFQRDPFRNGARVPEPGRNLYVNIAFHY